MERLTKETIQKEKRLLDPAWFEEAYKKGFLYYMQAPIKERVYKEIRLLAKKCEEIYTGEWDWDFTMLDKDVVINTETEGIYSPEWDPEKKAKTTAANISVINITGVLVMFEEVIIRNRNGKTHNIKGLVTRIAFPDREGMMQNDKLCIYHIQGARIEMSFKEYQSNYFHSHLSQTSSTLIDSSSTYPVFTGFCTGSGEINIYRSNLNDEITEERLERFLVQLMALVSYESLEGTPYKTMSSISGRVESGRRYFHYSPHAKEALDKMKRHFKDSKTVPNINFTIGTNNLYKLKKDESLDKFLDEFPWSREDKARYFSFRSVTGDVYCYGETPRSITALNTKHKKFLFRGEERVLKIENPSNKAEDIAFTLDQNIKNYITNKIEYDINKQAIRESTVNRYKNPNGDARKNISPDSILVSADS